MAKDTIPKPNEHDIAMVEQAFDETLRRNDDILDAIEELKTVQAQQVAEIRFLRNLLHPGERDWVIANELRNIDTARDRIDAFIAVAHLPEKVQNNIRLTLWQIAQAEGEIEQVVFGARGAANV